MSTTVAALPLRNTRINELPNTVKQVLNFIDILVNLIKDQPNYSTQPTAARIPIIKGAYNAVQARFAPPPSATITGNQEISLASKDINPKSKEKLETVLLSSMLVKFGTAIDNVDKIQDFGSSNVRAIEKLKNELSAMGDVELTGTAKDKSTEFIARKLIERLKDTAGDDTGIKTALKYHRDIESRIKPQEILMEAYQKMISILENEGHINLDLKEGAGTALSLWARAFTEAHPVLITPTPVPTPTPTPVVVTSPLVPPLFGGSSADTPLASTMFSGSSANPPLAPSMFSGSSANPPLIPTMFSGSSANPPLTPTMFSGSSANPPLISPLFSGTP